MTSFKSSISTVFVLASFLAHSVPSSAARQELKSPDGLTVVSISDEGNRATYSVSYNGKDFILPSPLGLNTNIYRKFRQ